MSSSHYTTSVVICTYNGSQYLEQQIQSILHQTVLPSEIIICDDNSSDNSKAILDPLKKCQLCHVRVFYNEENLGFTKNFEKAISLASGKIIFFSDQDDIWFPGKISHVLGLFMKYSDIVGITHDGRLVDSDLKWNGTTKSTQIVNGYGPNLCEITGALSAIRSIILPFLVPIPDGVVGHDKWLTYIFSLFPERWLHSPVCLQLIRRHSSNTSEWVVNSIENISRLDVFIAEASTPLATTYRDRMLVNEAIRKRLLDKDLASSLFESAEISNALNFLHSEICAINSRESIVSCPSRWIRFRKSILLWFSGGYIYFNGIKSLARDLLR